MSDIMKTIENPDAPSSRHDERKVDLQDWNKKQGQNNAEQESIKFTDEHWEVVNCLRDYYQHHEPVRNDREIGDMLNSKYVVQGIRKFLRRLLPEGPVGQNMRIAGLNVPPGIENAGSGTSR